MGVPCRLPNAPTLRPSRAALHYLRRRRVVAGGIGAGLARPAIGQAPWPQRPLRMVVGAPPGGGQDIVARLLAGQLAAQLGQPVVIENRAGANGIIATEQAARAGDGHTLLFGSVGPLAINNELYPRLGFDTMREFVPVAHVVETFFYLVAARRLPVATLPEFIAHARAHPGLRVGSPGIGSAHHLGFELLRRAFGLTMTHVPYRGSALSVADFAAGHLDFLVETYGLIEPVLAGGQGRLLATTAAARLADLPDVPTVAEAAPLPGFALSAWMALMAPAATPAPIVARLAEATRHALRPDSEIVPALATQRYVPRYLDPEATRALIAAERARYGALIREAGIRPGD